MQCIKISINEHGLLKGNQSPAGCEIKKMSVHTGFLNLEMKAKKILAITNSSQ